MGFSSLPKAKTFQREEGFSWAKAFLGFSRALKN